MKISPFIGRIMGNENRGPPPRPTKRGRWSHTKHVDHASYPLCKPWFLLSMVLNFLSETVLLLSNDIVPTATEAFALICNYYLVNQVLSHYNSTTTNRHTRRQEMVFSLRLRPDSLRIYKLKVIAFILLISSPLCHNPFLIAAKTTIIGILCWPSGTRTFY